MRYDEMKKVLRDRGEDVEAVLDSMKRDFIDNECDTDEYRETQPEKGLTFVRDAIEAALGSLGDREITAKLCRLTAAWLEVVAGRYEVPPLESSYAGAEELKPVLELVWEVEVRQGHHPYWEAEWGEVLTTFDEYRADTTEA